MRLILELNMATWLDSVSVGGKATTTSGEVTTEATRPTTGEIVARVSRPAKGVGPGEVSNPMPRHRPDLVPCPVCGGQEPRAIDPSAKSKLADRHALSLWFAQTVAAGAS